MQFCASQICYGGYSLTSLIPRLSANCAEEEKREPGLHCMCMRKLGQPTDVNREISDSIQNLGRYLQSPQIHSSHDSIFPKRNGSTWYKYSCRNRLAATQTRCLYFTCSVVARCYSLYWRAVGGWAHMRLLYQAETTPWLVDKPSLVPDTYTKNIMIQRRTNITGH